MDAEKHLPFRGDFARAWIAVLCESQGTRLIAAQFDRVLKRAPGFLDARDAETAIAAVDALTRLQRRNRFRDASTQKLDHWARAQQVRPNPALIAKAKLVLERVQGPESALRDQWAASGQLEAWQKSMAALHTALGP